VVKSERALLAGGRTRLSRGKLYTATVVSTTRGVYRSCSQHHSHDYLRVPLTVTGIFAKRLKAARALRGLSQRALGALVSGNKENGSVRINRYEQEVNRADMDTAASIAQALEVPLAYLFAEADDQADMLLAFSQLSKAERAKLVEQAQQMVAAKPGRASRSKG